MSLFILQNDRACVLLLLFDVVEFGSMFDATLSFYDCHICDFKGAYEY